ncbi:hypothetical protein VUR80DRAFT_3842 [Thermomyces stellatus]
MKRDSRAGIAKLVLRCFGTAARMWMAVLEALVSQHPPVNEPLTGGQPAHGTSVPFQRTIKRQTPTPTRPRKIACREHARRWTLGHFKWHPAPFRPQSCTRNPSANPRHPFLGLFGQDLTRPPFGPSIFLFFFSVQGAISGLREVRLVYPF